MAQQNTQNDITRKNMNTEYKIYQLKKYLKEQEEEKHLQKIYDPRRRYRKGDIVRARLYGRGFLWAKDGQIFNVAEDERNGEPGIVMKEYNIHTGKPIHLTYAEIELVKPIEENRPFEMHAADAIYKMLNGRKIMERPFIGAKGNPDFDSPAIQIKFIPGYGFQRKLANQRDSWDLYSLNKNDMEAKWREAEERE